MLSLNNIKAKRGQKKIKRVGRGNGSGHGTYCCKGQKGQNSRSGVTGLKRLGMRPHILQTPKIGGFRSLAPKNQVVKVAVINKNFKDGETVSVATLFAKGLIADAQKPVKVLGKEKLEVKIEFDKAIKLNQSIAAGLKK
ncbi:MAG: 50S ribosomal protein L15 [Patescibacteria group bacterium]|nr:50S ribosomal protein L15 [Patescibacteria group bacterium]